MPPAVHHGFRHEAFLYRDGDEFVAGTSFFVHEGLAEDAAVLVALPPTGFSLLADGLGPAADHVSFLDMSEVGRNPGRILAAWQRFVADHAGRGRPFRGIGEPAWFGRRDAELAECQLHEHLLNVAFERGPEWRLMCPYDESNLPPDVIAGAKRTHPEWSLASAARLSEDYVGPAGAAREFAASLPAAPPTAPTVGFGPGGVHDVRTVIAEFAGEQGVDGARIDLLQLAASELATNSIRHGGGAGIVRWWREPDAVAFEVSDNGRIGDLLAGRRPPSLNGEGGRGLFLVHQLCDLVQVRSSPGGTTVRVTTWL
jgi:anti-sigma regulatory factor (Ser/Thr protein kinase)